MRSTPADLVLVWGVRVSGYDERLGDFGLSGYKVMLGEAVGLAVEWQVTEETTILPPAADVLEGSWVKTVPGPSFFEWLGFAVVVVGGGSSASRGE